MSVITSYGSGGLNLTGNINNNGYALTIDGDSATTLSGTVSRVDDFVKSRQEP